MMHRLCRTSLATLVAVLLSAVLAACTQPVFSPHVLTKPIGGPAVAGHPLLIGGPGADSVAPGCLLRHRDGGFALFGRSNHSFDTSTDFLMVRLSEAGKVEWARTYGGRHRDSISRAAALPDGGFLMTGTSVSLFFTPLPGQQPRQVRLAIKAHSSGSPRWATLRPSGIASLVEPDGGFWISGWGWHLLDPKVRVAAATLERFNPDGSMRFRRDIFQAGQSPGRANGASLVSLGPGRVLQLVNLQRANDSHWADARPALIEWDADGNTGSAIVLDGLPSVTVAGITALSDGGLVVDGFLYREEEVYGDPVLIRLDSELNVKWAVAISTPQSVWLGDIVHTPQGGFVVGARLGKAGPGARAAILKVDGDGAAATALEFRAPQLVEANCLLALGNGEYAVAGTAALHDGSGLGSLDIFFARVQAGEDTATLRAGPPISLRKLSARGTPIELSVVSPPERDLGMKPEIPVQNLVHKQLLPTPPAP